MDIEKVYEEIGRLAEELSRMSPTDENYRSISENMERLSRIISEYEKRDQDRVNNNVRNDIQEEQLKVDQEKIKADRARTIANVVCDAIKVLGAIYLGKSAYDGEMVKFTMPIRGLVDWCKNLFPKR